MYSRRENTQGWVGNCQYERRKKSKHDPHIMIKQALIWTLGNVAMVICFLMNRDLYNTIVNTTDMRQHY